MRRTIVDIAKWNQGPTIEFVKDPGEGAGRDVGAAGYTYESAHVIQLNSRYASYVESVLSDNSSKEEKLTAFMRLYMTIIHETSHELSKYKSVNSQKPDGSYKYVYDKEYKSKPGDP